MVQSGDWIVKLAEKDCEDSWEDMGSQTPDTPLATPCVHVSTCLFDFWFFLFKQLYEPLFAPAAL